MVKNDLHCTFSFVTKSSVVWRAPTEWGIMKSGLELFRLWCIHKFIPTSRRWTLKTHPFEESFIFVLWLFFGVFTAVSPLQRLQAGVHLFYSTTFPEFVKKFRWFQLWDNQEESTHCWIVAQISHQSLFFIRHTNPDRRTKTFSLILWHANTQHGQHGIQMIKPNKHIVLIFCYHASDTSCLFF